MTSDEKELLSLFFFKMVISSNSLSGPESYFSLTLLYINLIVKKILSCNVNFYFKTPLVIVILNLKTERKNVIFLTSRDVGNKFIISENRHSFSVIHGNDILICMNYQEHAQKF